MSDPADSLPLVARAQKDLACSDCGRRAPQWAGRCAACGAWGTIGEAGAAGVAANVVPLYGAPSDDGQRLASGIPGLDRVLGGGVIPGSVVLLAGEPGIGKSTLILQAVAGLVRSGATAVVASGEETRAQIAGRARRLGLGDGALRYSPGRDLGEVLAAAAAERPGVLVVDSVQTVRSEDVTGTAGGVGQVRACTDALVGLAKREGCAIILVGHVTKDGDLAGPRTLEHAVDAVLTFAGDARSGLRTLVSGKNRFGAEGEVAWFEMTPAGLIESDPSALLADSAGEPGAALALPLAGRRAVAAEVQGLVVDTDGPPRRHASGLDARRLSMIAAVLEQSGVRVARAEVYAAATGGLRIDDPGADLAIAAALASARSGRPPPLETAFVGEISLTGTVRQGPGMGLRMAAARAAGVRTIVAPEGSGGGDGVAIRPVRHVREALSWSRSDKEPRGPKMASDLRF